MFVKYTKFAFLSAVLLVFFVPTVGLAVDSRCWTKSACEAGSETAMPGSFYGPYAETIDACQMSQDPFSKQPIGFCLAAGTAETKVDFGGKNSFTNIGEFIKWIYKYGVAVASILAVVMIISAGFNWAISGGNTEKISAARKKIGGAMMGLFLAVMSYFILNMINPYMVNMRMPQVWMINTSGLTPVYCDQIKDSKKVSLEKGGSFKLEPSTTACGKDYYVEGTPDLTCKGRYCAGSICMDSGESASDGKHINKCYSGVLGGKIGAPKEWFCSDLDDSIIDSGLMLIAMCNNGDIEEVADVDPGSLPKTAREYTFGNKSMAIKTEIQTVCVKKDGLAGFYLGADVNDEGGGFFGKKCPGNPGSVGADDWFAIGKSGSGGCDVNLAKVAYRVFNGGKEPSCSGDSGPENCSCNSISDEPTIQQLVKSKEFLKHLITKEELLSGLSCDIFIDRDEFPALDNAYSASAIFCNLGADPTSCWCSQNIT